MYFRPGEHGRIAGKMQLHQRLRVDEQGRPRLQVFSTCRDFIRTLPALPYSQSNPEDVSTDAEDHIYDETRYFCMLNPMPAAQPAVRRRRGFSPYEEMR